MEYQKIIKVSKNSHQNNPETVANENDKEIPKERYISPEVKFKSSMLKSSLYDYSDAYILVSGIITITGK